MKINTLLGKKLDLKILIQQRKESKFIQFLGITETQNKIIQKFKLLNVFNICFIKYFI